MVHKFNAQDVVFWLWIRRYRILAIALAACLLAGVYTLIGAIPAAGEVVPGTACYKTTAFFRVESTEDSESDSLSLSLNARNAYLKGFRMEFFSEFLIDNLPDVDLEKVLLKHPMIEPPNAAISNLQIRWVYNAVLMEGAPDLPWLMVSYYAVNPDLGDRIVDLCMEYAEDIIDIPWSTVTALNSRIEEIIIQPPEAEAFAFGSFINAAVKNMVMLTLLMEALYIVILMCQMAFRPTINFKPDLDQTGKFPVWETQRKNRAGSAAYITKKLLAYIEDGGDKQILITALSPKTGREKNKNAALLLRGLQDAGKQAVLINFDSACQLPDDGGLVIEGELAGGYSLGLDRYEQQTAGAGAVLVNLPPFFDCISRFDKQRKHVLLLNAVYGKTLKDELKQAIAICEENDIQLLAAVADPGEARKVVVSD
ncbi:MAG: hypothetical protein FWE80_04070 [Oscillospiraceae bacterium]|nr:hypothetical protein [Oscillospiraceae bacterium]